MYTQVRSSGECLQFMWHFCELKFAGSALDNLDASVLRFSCAKVTVIFAGLM